jgi:diguanylate cyclase (GGDEF)-like protein
MFELKRYLKKLGGRDASLASSIQTMDDLTRLLGVTLECYMAALDSVGEHAPDSPRALREELRKQIKRLHALVEQAPDMQTLPEVRRRFDAELKAYGRHLESFLNRQERDVKEVMGMVASLADSIASRDKQFQVRFRGIAKKLRLLTTSEDLAEIRLRLAEEIGQLERCVDDIERDTQAALDRVRTDLQTRSTPRRAEPWLGEPTDKLTNLPGRKQMLAILEARRGADYRFSLVWFGIDKFNSLIERQGASLADSLVAEFAKNLKHLLQAATVVCRWGDAEFIALLEGNLPDVVTLASELERKLSAGYSVPNRNERIVVRCRSAVAQPLRGESVEQMVRRLRTEAGVDAVTG